MGPLGPAPYTPPRDLLGQVTPRTTLKPQPLGRGFLLSDPWTKPGCLPVAAEWTDESVESRRVARSQQAEPARTNTPEPTVRRTAWSDPARVAARVVARTKRAERLATYLAQGLTSVAAEERATRDAYEEINKHAKS